LLEIRINTTVQLWKHYYRRCTHETGRSMCVVKNVFFH